MQPDEAQETYRRLDRLFNDAALYLTQVPTYAFGYMTLGWGANSARTRATDAATVKARFDAANIETRYYTPGIHAGCFNLPAYMNL